MTTLAELNAGSKVAFVMALGDVFEQSLWVAEAVASQRPFVSLNALYDALAKALRGADAAKQKALIQAHPDLAGKATKAGTLTADSTAEQAAAGLDRLSDGEYATFHRLNDAYRVKFGMPFIVCVRRHTKDSILREFERRLANDPAQERETALIEILRIAALRLDQKVAANDKLPLAGRISTHVLDTSRGKPAAGVPVELFEIAADGSARFIARAVTNADGRTDAPLIGDRPVPIGSYELRFDLGGYFGDQAVLGLVPVRFKVAEAENHYHVPLLVSPWGYTTYRGS
jgi:2-oxo-4-hydroxy-4-carboxy-5-ureidoimidazoline decarboxylase